ncbi:hypothetical protein niasHT_031225 [Heterodera trifolii]|uniref:Ubiquitin-like protease family profile domain-containing protein n=1 Tax=Heterodera trifolii TaxID=157864 RepID=A0ABD2IUH1_9BILA
MRSIFLGKGRTELAHNVFTSTLPRRLICCFISTDAYSGDRKLSPFKFEHANVRAISAETNGQSFPSTPYLLSFDGAQQRFVRAFVDMYAGLGLDDSDTKTVSIGMQRFLSGWAFFVIPMTSTLDDTPGFELIRQGTCTLKVQFEKPIKEDGYEMLILGEFDSVLSINADRVLSTDGSVLNSGRKKRDMNSAQIDMLLRRMRVTSGKFIGVYPSDKIPLVLERQKRLRRYPHCMVVNTDREGTRGEHWIACYVPCAKRIEYFDSLGAAPNPDLSAYLNKFQHVQVNTHQIQFLSSDACGHFCVYFLASRCSGTPFCDVVETLRKTRGMADWLVKWYVRTLAGHV